MRIGVLAIVLGLARLATAAPVPDFVPVAEESASARQQRDLDEMPGVLATAPRATATRPVDPWQLPTIRVDGGLGFALGDGPGSFAARGHAGVSHWLLGADHDGWRAATRFTAGLSLGLDMAGHQDMFPTAAPFVEVGVGIVNATDIAHEHGRQSMLYVRAEPVLLPGALNEHALRVGAGLSLHGHHRLFPDNDNPMASVAAVIGAPVIAALNLHDIELTTDLGVDGQRQYGLMMGFWSR